MTAMAKLLDMNWRNWAMQLLPIATGALLIAMRRQHGAGADQWSVFLTLLGIQLVAAIPLMAAHLAAYRLPPSTGALLWIAAFALYPYVLPHAGFDTDANLMSNWLLMALLSALTLLFGRRGESPLIDIVRRLPVTLDGAIAFLLGLWVIAVSLLFISTPDPVNNQPLSIWFDGMRIVENPGLFLGYLIQFGFAAALLFAYYSVCRYALIRGVLRDQGWIAFLLTSLAFWVIATPGMASLVIPLPLNEPHWTILPSETANPFAAENYGFTFAIWAVVCPIVLVSERLLQERSDAMSQHEQVRAELSQLHEQINPHFLFNTLNTLYALCLRDREASAQAILKLSDLLRYSVYEAREDWVSLDSEIRHVRTYLDLQMLRFGRRCTVEDSWPDDDEAFQIPPQMLIMLIENAFKHGVEPANSDALLSIDLAITDGWMHFSCENSPAAGQSATSEAGVGLANLRRRLELLCGNEFTLENGLDGNRWRSVLRMKLRSC